MGEKIMNVFEVITSVLFVLVPVALVGAFVWTINTTVAAGEITIDEATEVRESLIGDLVEEGYEDITASDPEWSDSFGKYLVTVTYYDPVNDQHICGVYHCDRVLPER